MKKLLFLIFATAITACGGRYGSGVPAAYEPLLDAALAQCPRSDELVALLGSTPRAEREAMAHLIAWMPAGDRDTMSLDLLRENVSYACRARAEFPWAREIPQELFLDEVLPYASVDEVRDSWRPDFYERFKKRVAACTTLREAAEAVNRAIVEETGVEYNTLREKTNQSPAESIRQHMASCTGLSILLVDALRSVGIPARFVGTAAWHDDRGNHSWTEVWVDGDWRITEYYYPGYDTAWFMADAGKADAADRLHAIYAVSFRPSDDAFPMVWNWESRDVHAENVTDRYVAHYKAFCDEAEGAGTHVRLALRMFDRHRTRPAASGDRVEANVDLFAGDLQVGGGRTAGTLRDMNDALTFLVEKNGTYTFRYANERGEQVAVDVAVGEEPVVVDCYMDTPGKTQEGSSSCL